MKTKSITIQGLSFTIGWLSSRQVEEMMEEEIAPGDRKRWRERAWRTVIQGLNNPIQGESKEEPWTENRLRTLLDDKFPGGEVGQHFNQLHIAVLDFSGLKVGAVGEAQAAQDLTSTQSAAA